MELAFGGFDVDMTSVAEEGECSHFFGLDMMDSNASAIKKMKMSTSFGDVVRIMQMKHKMFSELRYDPSNQFAVFSRIKDGAATILTLMPGYVGEVLLHILRVHNKASPSHTCVLQINLYDLAEIEKQIMEAVDCVLF
jgi:hypothetical protein